MRRLSGWTCLALALGLAGCATAPVERAARALPGGDQEVTIEMVRFTFVPDVIRVRAGAPLTITGVSNSRIPHDITVLTPEGLLLESEDVPARRTVTIRTTLSKPGRYVFYCSKFLHRRPFGMEGVLIAE